MIYKTVYGQFKKKYIESKQGLYWLTQEIMHQGFGYALLKRTHKGSYEVVRILKDINKSTI